MRIVLFVMLLLNGIFDLKKREISLLLTGLTGSIGLFLLVCQREEGSEWVWILSLLPGILLLLTALLLPEEAGMGDALVLLVMGTVLTPPVLLRVFLRAAMAAGICGFLHEWAKRERGMSVPFIPFLFLSYLIWWFGEGMHG